MTFVECCHAAGSVITGRVPVQELQGFAPGGGSASVVALAEDGNEYIVKFGHNGQGSPRLLANEFVCAYLAVMLSLPCAPPYIIDVDDGAIQRAAKWLATRHPYNMQLPSAGPAFGSAIFPQAQKVHGNGLLVTTVINRRDAAGIIMFDSWVHNTDRKNEGNVLIYPDPTAGGQFRMVMIDQGFICAAAGWTAETLDADRVVILSTFLEDMVPVPLSRVDFEPYLDRLEGLTAEVVAAAVESFPGEWQCPSVERESMRRYFVDRQGLVRPAIYAAYP